MADAARRFSQIRWRRSRNAARPWVRPQMLPGAARGAITRAKAARGRGGQPALEEEPVVLISLSGRTFGADPEQLAIALFAKLAQVVGRDLQRSRDGRVTSPSQWALDYDDRGQWTGRGRLQLQNMTEAKAIHAALHGLPVWLGADWATLSVSHAALPLAPPDRAAGGQAVGESGRPSP